MRYELTDNEWSAIKPMLPNKPRGVPRVNDRRVLNGIFWVLRSGAPWRDLPDIFGPYTTCYNRFIRWRRAGVWAKLMSVLAGAHDAAVQMIDTSIVRVHQHGACITRNRRQSMGRSRGGLTSKIHAVVDTNGLPVRLALTAGEAHDNRLAGKLLSRLKSGTMLLADRGYDADWIRALVRQHGGLISHQKEIGQRRYASVRISTALGTWSSGSSIRSSTAAGLQRATTSSPLTTLHSFNSRRSGYGCALMSPRPRWGRSRGRSSPRDPHASFQLVSCRPIRR
jgi:transposase